MYQQRGKEKALIYRNIAEQKLQEAYDNIKMTYVFKSSLEHFQKYYDFISYRGLRYFRKKESK